MTISGFARRTGILGAAIGLSLVLGGPCSAAEPPMVGGAAMYPTKNIIENAVNSKDHMSSQRS